MLLEPADPQLPGAAEPSSGLEPLIPGVLGPLLADLHSDDPHRRAEAARRLGELGPVAGIAAPRLARIYRETEDGSELGSIAWNALRAIGPTCIRNLLEAFDGSDDDFALRYAIGEVLRPESVPYLGSVVRDRRFPLPLRCAAAKQLAEFYNDHSVAELLPALSDDLDEIRSAAADSLDRLPIHDESRRIAELLDDPRPTVRATAASLLHRSETEFVDVLVRAFSDPDARVRRAVVRTIPSGRTPSGAEVADIAIRDPDDRVRFEAAAALAGDRDARAGRDFIDIGLPLLFEALSRDDADRAIAVGALRYVGRLADPVIPKLLELFRSDLDADLRNRTYETLLALAPSQTFVELFFEAGVDPAPRVRRAAAAWAAWVRDLTRSQTVQALSTASTDPDWNVACQAARSLGGLGYSEAAPALIAAMSSSNNCVRAAAAEAAGHTGPATDCMIAALTAGLSDDDGDVTRNSAWALGRTAPASEAAAEALIAAVHRAREWGGESRYLEALSKFTIRLQEIVDLIVDWAENRADEYDRDHIIYWLPWHDHSHPMLRLTVNRLLRSRSADLRICVMNRLNNDRIGVADAVLENLAHDDPAVREAAWATLDRLTAPEPETEPAPPPSQ